MKTGLSARLPAAGILLALAAAALATAAAAQDAPARARAAAPAVVETPARAVAAAPATVRIDASQLSASPPRIDAAAIDQRGPGGMLARPAASAATGAAGSLAAPPPGRLRITLSPKKPAVENRAYLEFTYPLTVDIAPGRDEVAFSPGNMPGWFHYHARLQRDRKYLVEIDVRHRGAPDSNVRHSIGEHESTHQLGKGDAPITAILAPTADGWVSGTLRQGSKPGYGFTVHQVKISEME